MSIVNIKEYIKPNTSKSLKEWIIFTNQHHNGNKTHEETIESFRGTVLGDSLDFDKLDNPPPPDKPKGSPVVREVSKKEAIKHLFGDAQDAMRQLFGDLT